MVYHQLPLSWPGTHYRAKTEQIKCRVLVGIWSNLLSPPGHGWLLVGREKRSAAPKLFVTGDCYGSPRLQKKKKKRDLWLSCGFNWRASTQFKGNQKAVFHSFCLWWTASWVTEMTIIKWMVVLCSSLLLWCYSSLMWPLQAQLRSAKLVIIFLENFEKITAVHHFWLDSSSLPASSWGQRVGGFCWP